VLTGDDLFPRDALFNLNVDYYYIGGTLLVAFLEYNGKRNPQKAWNCDLVIRNLLFVRAAASFK